LPLVDAPPVVAAALAQADVLAQADESTGHVSPLMVVIVVLALLLVVGGGLVRVIGQARARRATAERGTWVSAPGTGGAPSRPDAGEPLLTEARALFVAVQEAWDARDDRRMGRLLGPELLADWRRHRDDFEAMGWRSRISVLGAPEARLVGDLGRHRGEDRVVVAIACDVSSWIATDAGELLPRGTGTVEDDDLRLEQRWTLGRRGGRWVVVAIDEGAADADDPA
jgi:predicted lipid-binding transport protein (Tim44 family)